MGITLATTHKSDIHISENQNFNKTGNKSMRKHDKIPTPGSSEIIILPPKGEPPPVKEKQGNQQPQSS